MGVTVDSECSPTGISRDGEGILRGDDEDEDEGGRMGCRQDVGGRKMEWNGSWWEGGNRPAG